MGKKERKQFQLVDKDSCAIYLLKIITTVEKCLIKLKDYNAQHKELLEKYEGEGQPCIPYEVYGEFVDKTGNVRSYLLNALGDAQDSSISYFKYRKQAQKLIDRGVEGIGLCVFSDELTALIVDFNKMRNWSNHIPESLLICEEEAVREGKAIQSPYNPIEIYLHETVTFEYFEDLYDNNCSFYQAARRLAQACKRDYGCLIGESITVVRKYFDTPIDLRQLQAATKSADIQGIEGNII